MSDHNPYAPPRATVSDAIDEDNTSGMGPGYPIPPGVTGWSWGGFLWGWIWAIGNKTWIGLLAIVPYVGFIMRIVLGVKGREWAWQNKRWDSVEHFREVQRKWAVWWLYIMGGIVGLGILAAIVIPLANNH